MEITVVKDWRGVEEVARRMRRPQEEQEPSLPALLKLLTMNVENLGDMYRVYWECNPDEGRTSTLAPQAYSTKEEVWWGDGAENSP